MQLRFDVLYQFVHMARFSTVAIPEHVAILHKVFQYLYSTRSDSLVYGGDFSKGFKLIGYVDASFPSSPDAIAQFGFVIVVEVGGHRNVLQAKSQKADHIVTSVCDSELSSSSLCAMSLMTVRPIFIELGIMSPSAKAILYIDNMATVTVAQDGGYHPALAHINRKHKYIMECVEKNQLEVLWIPGNKNPADCLTKPLGRSALDELRSAFFSH